MTDRVIIVLYDQKSQILIITIGLKQGSSASPKLYSFYINPLLPMIEATGKLRKLFDLTLGILAYADNLVIAC